MKPTASLAFCIILSLSAHPRASAPRPAPPPPRPAQEAAREFRAVADGVEHLRQTRGAGDERWAVNVLRLDLTRVDIAVARAFDAGVGVETTSSLAARHAALAAVNGGYFRTAAGVYRGEPQGILAHAGRLLSEPQRGRAALGVWRTTARTELRFGYVEFRGSVRSQSGREHAVGGVNRPRAADELVVYTPEFHRTTLTGPGGVEAVVRRGRVAQVRADLGSSLIPADGFVLSGAGRAAEWLRQNLARGSRVRINLDLLDAGGGGGGRRAWASAAHVIGGGPQLVKEGRVDITGEREGFDARGFVNARHPRTAAGRDRAGRVLLVTVDGRQPGVSAGMTLDELARLLVEFGAVEAINLDGGGSTTMVVRGEVVNKPSDREGERPVSDAILVLPRGRAGAP